MKKALVVCLSSLVLALSLAPSFAGMPFAPANIIAVHIGPKNATFDESKFPDIKFYYTPGLKWTTEKTTGKPVFLSNWLNKKGLRTDELIVLDKNGVVAFKNVIMNSKRLEDNFSQGDLDSLGNVLRNVIEKNNSAPYVTDKPFDPADVSLLGRKLPDFTVTNASGDALSMASILGADTSPKVIFFFMIPPSHVFQDVSESMSTVTSPLQALGAITSASMGDEYIGLLKRIEEELYGR